MLSLNVDEETKESEKKVSDNSKEVVTVNGVKDPDGIQTELPVDKEVELSSHDAKLSDVNASDVRLGSEEDPSNDSKPDCHFGSRVTARNGSEATKDFPLGIISHLNSRSIALDLKRISLLFDME
ncbi:hypothetical protein Bca101_073878 [Brassica carinata]